MWNYFITLFFIYLGLAVGYLISHFSKEELKPGKKYFIFLKAALFGLILMTFFVDIGLNMMIVFPIVLILFTAIFFWLKKFDKIIHNELFFSVLLAIILAETFSKYVSILTFMFYIVSASLDYEKGLLKILKNRIFFLIIGIILKIQYVLLLFQ